MGVDYRAVLVFGVEIKDLRAFFGTESTEEEVLCDHPEARGVTYCPVCGIHKDKRIKRVKTWAPKKLFRAAFDEIEVLDDDDDLTWYLDHPHEGLMDLDIGGLSVIDLTNSERWVLGVVGGTSSWRSEIVTESGAETRGRIHSVMDRLLSLGITEPCQTYLCLQAC